MMEEEGEGGCMKRQVQVPHVWEALISCFPNQVDRLQGNSFPTLTYVSPGRSPVGAEKAALLV